VTDEVKTRSYDNSGRAARARETRRTILESAKALLIENGYAGTTVPLIAERAGVAVETVYKHFGNKRALTREVLDVAIAGDDEPVAMVNRAEAQAIASADGAHDMVRLYARYVRGINERMGPLHAVLFTSARAGEPDLQELAAEADEQRLTGARIFARLLISTGETHPDLGIDEAADIIWALNFNVFHRTLTAERGWSREAYEQVVERILAGALLATREEGEAVSTSAV
jgi:AcrR family transcriptional regulator